MNDSHFEAARSELQIPVQQTPASGCIESDQENQSDEIIGKRDTSVVLTMSLVGDEGLAHIAESSKKQSLPKVRAAESGAVSPDSTVTDPMLAIVQVNWPRLSEIDRTAIVAIAQAAIDRP